MNEENIKKEIFEKIKEFYELKHKKRVFVEEKTKIRYAGRVFDEKEMIAATDAVLDFWLTLGKYTDLFEADFSKLLGMKHAIVTNSGSSANLLAVSALKSSELKNRLKNGDEVITPASTFPTTFNPIIQNNLMPVLVDINLGNYNTDVSQLKKALSKKTKALLIPHTLGIPNEMDAVMDFVKEHNLFLIEDACDALGSKYANKVVGSFGDISAFSFYPAHHITMGEGGALATNDELLDRIIRSIRDWGRACYCKPGEKNPLGACGRRFSFLVGGIKYDHRYMYSNIGYNLKPTDIQVAIGYEQLKKLPEFVRARKKNFNALYKIFSKYNSFLLPDAPEKADVSWFAFPLTIKKGADFSRTELVSFLEKNNIQVRLLFTGNILHHPGYKEIKCRKIGKLENTEEVFRNSFFLGVYPGLLEEEITYIEKKVSEFMRKR
jgi:CDP-6-deoxy-D-xylo-4-hexulose-3-dehydrase